MQLEAVVLQQQFYASGSLATPTVTDGGDGYIVSEPPVVAIGTAPVGGQPMPLQSQLLIQMED